MMQITSTCETVSRVLNIWNIFHCFTGFILVNFYLLISPPPLTNCIANPSLSLLRIQFIVKSPSRSTFRMPSSLPTSPLQSSFFQPHSTLLTTYPYCPLHHCHLCRLFRPVNGDLICLFLLQPFTLPVPFFSNKFPSPFIYAL